MEACYSFTGTNTQFNRVCFINSQYVYIAMLLNWYIHHHFVIYCIPPYMFYISNCLYLLIDCIVYICFFYMCTVATMVWLSHRSQFLSTSTLCEKKLQYWWRWYLAWLCDTYPLYGYSYFKLSLFLLWNCQNSWRIGKARVTRSVWK